MGVKKTVYINGFLDVESSIVTRIFWLLCRENRPVGLGLGCPSLSDWQQHKLETLVFGGKKKEPVVDGDTVGRKETRVNEDGIFKCDVSCSVTNLSLPVPLYPGQADERNMLCTTNSKGLSVIKDWSFCTELLRLSTVSCQPTLALHL